MVDERAVLTRDSIHTCIDGRVDRRPSYPRLTGLIDFFNSLRSKRVYKSRREIDASGFFLFWSLNENGNNGIRVKLSDLRTLFESVGTIKVRVRACTSADK